MKIEGRGKRIENRRSRIEKAKIQDRRTRTIN
jgi:hypothetical protein